MAHIALTQSSKVRLAVLNPGGRDSYLDYNDGFVAYEKGVHAPVNFHAYAAATGGAFFDSTEAVISEKERFDAVIVLIRRRTWITLKAIEKLKANGMKVYTCWKECALHQIAGQLKSPKAISAYSRILELADRIISPTLAWPPRCGKIEQNEFWRKLTFLPTPYPVDCSNWDFSVPVSDRCGILIGTREFKTDSRNHIHAIARVASLAHELGVPRVSVINSENKAGLKMLEQLARSFPPHSFHIYRKSLSYPDYMSLLASHRFVFQMDRSTVPGQVAGDCLLARTLCLGGSSSIEKIAFEEYCDDGSIRGANTFEALEKLLCDDDHYEAAIAKSQAIAADQLSFGAIARRFAELRDLA